PRLAPQLFGVGLLEEVADADTASGAQRYGRFGWQGTALSIRDQAAQAFAFEMGVTSEERLRDDCTASEADCLQQPNGGSPEVSAELFDAVVQFQRWLAVPQPPRQAAGGQGRDNSQFGEQLFTKLGCVACHRPTWPIQGGVIAPYTDLRLHDLG